MAFRLLDQATTIGASLPVKLSRGITDHLVQVTLEPTTTTDFTVCEVELQGSFTNPLTSQSTQAVLAIGSTAQRIKNTNAFYYQVAGTNYTVAAGAGGTVITDIGGTAITGTITDNKYGGVNVYVSTGGVLRCRLPVGLALNGLQAYNSAALCIAALKLVPTPSEYCLLGRAVTLCSSAFTYGTTALTGVTTFFDEPCPYFTLAKYSLDATDLAASQAFFHVTGKTTKYARAYLSALTGTGMVTVKYFPNEVM